MPNEENLKRLTPSEARMYGRMGGKASGEARRRKADFRKTLNTLLTAKIDNPDWNLVLESLGLESTLEAAVNAAMIKEALRGNVKAYEVIAKYSGQSVGTDADLEEQRIRMDRAKRARDQEVGADTDGMNENIQTILRALNPTEKELSSLFGEGGDAKETEESGEV